MGGDKVGVGHAEARVCMDGQGGAGDRIGEAAGEEVGEPERAVGVVVERIVRRAEAQGLLGVLHRPLVPLAVGADQGAEAPGERGVGIEAERPVERLDRAVVVAGEIGADEGADARGLRVVGIDAEDAVGMPERGGAVGGVEAAAEVALLAAPGGGGVGRQKAGIERERPLEARERAVAVAGRVRERVGERLEVEVVGIEAFGPLAACPVDLGAADRGLDQSDDGLGQTVLQVEDICVGAVEAAGPESAWPRRPRPAGR